MSDISPPQHVRFTIEGRLPGLNEIISQNRSNRFYGAKVKKDTTNYCSQIILVSLVPKFYNPIAIAFRWIEPNHRRDIDNITVGAKFILDALVQTERLWNDTKRWVKQISHEFPEPDAKFPRIEVDITEIRTNGPA